MKKTNATDDAIITLLIGAMNANRYVSPREGARAHHLIWSTRRFRRKSGETVGRLIEDAKERLEAADAAAAITRAAKAIPARLRPAVYAVAADLLLADGTIDPAERRFLRRLGLDFGLAPAAASRIVEAILVKNAL